MPRDNEPKATYPPVPAPAPADRLRLAAEAAGLGVYDADLISGTLYWSPEACVLLGLAPDAVPPPPGTVPDFVHPEDREHVAQVLAAALGGSGDGRVLDTHRILLPDGRVRWVRLQGQVHCAEQGTERRATRVIGVIQDVTESVEAERQAAADLDAMTRLQRLGTLFVREGNLEPVLTEIVDAAMTIAGADFGTIQLLDPATGDLHIAAQRGFEPWWIEYWERVAAGRGTCGTALARGERVLVEDLTQSALFSGEDLKIQLRAGVRAVQSTRLTGRTGRPLGMFSTHYRRPQRFDARALSLLDLLARQAADIVERAQAEAELAWTARRNRLLSETAARLLSSDEPQDPIESLCREVMDLLDCQVFFYFLKDADSGRLRLQACAGVSQEVARSIRRLADMRSVCSQVASEGQRFLAEDIPNRPDPRTALLASLGLGAYCCHPLRGEGGSIGTLSFGTRTRARFDAREIESMAAVADLVASALQRIEAARVLRASEEALREADRRKDAFLATLGHELRNPLAPIRNACAILKLAGTPDSPGRRAVDMIERQVTHLVRLVDDLLDVSRIARGKLSLHREPTELAPVLERAVELARPLIDGAGHTLTLDLPREPIRLSADPVRLAQVFSNLLNNACKFTPPGGRIRLAAERSGGQAVVRVEDSGQGIPPEHLPHVFDTFRQVPVGTDAVQSGLGIGLSLVRGLVEMHGGRVAAESAGPGRGSCFTVRLPAEAAPARSASGHLHDPDEPAGASGRVLVVDDQEDVAESLAIVLRLLGSEVATARDGLDALEVAERFRPHLVLMDLGMPRLDGCEACRRLRERPWGTKLKVVALTGWGQEGERRRSEEAGFDAHWVKPVAPGAVMELLAEARAAHP